MNTSDLDTGSSLARTLSWPKAAAKPSNTLRITTRASVDWLDYIIYYQDMAALAKNYVSELSEFIDVAQHENKRILNKHNLL